MNSVFFCILLSTTYFQNAVSSTHQLSYDAPISSTFLLELTNEKRSCGEKTCVDSIINNDSATKITTFVSHTIVENLLILDTNQKEDTKDFIGLLEKDAALLLRQKHCLMDDKDSALCILSYNDEGNSFSISLKLSIVSGSGELDRLVLVVIDANLSTNKNELSQKVLTLSATKLDKLFGGSSTSSPLWSIRQRPAATSGQSEELSASHTGLINNSNDVSALFLQNMLSDPFLQKNRVYTSTDHNDAEIWEFVDHSKSNVAPTKALFLNSNLRYLSKSVSAAHAEAFIHPSLLNHPQPTRVAVLSKTPLAYIREILKYESIQTIELVGADESMLKSMIDAVPELNDCSGFTGIDEKCMDNVRVESEDVDEWLDRMINEEATSDTDDDENYANYPKFDVIYIDSPASSSMEEINWLSIPFIKKLTMLLDFKEDDSMIVINSGHAPTLDNDNNPSISEELRYELLKKGAQVKFREIDFDAIAVYDEPLAQPLNSAYIILFYEMRESYSRFFREKSTTFDIDIMNAFRPVEKLQPPTILYDGPTQERYKRPSRSWETWFCGQDPWKQYYLCTEFLGRFFNKKYHHFHTEVRDHEIKNRALYTLEEIPEGHFINTDDDSSLIHVDDYQWEKLQHFISAVPSATMYKDIRDFMIAYGYQTYVLGLTGWSVSFASNQTFTNHACTIQDASVSAVEKAFQTDEGYNTAVIFNPAIQRRSSMFSVLSVATRDLKEGDELMIDYASFRDTVDDDFQKFLDQICETGVGLVPNKEEDDELASF